MQLPYTPDQPLDPPDDGEIFHEKCEMCLEVFKSKDLYLHQQNGKAHLVCSECLNYLHQDIELRIR